MGRRSVRESIRAFVASIEGVREAHAGQPKNIARFPAVVVKLPTSDESAPTMPRGVGRKMIEYRARLDVLDFSPEKNVIESELAFDDLVDQITTTIRENFTLNGTVHSAGTKYIRVEVADPRLAGQDQGSVFRLATIEFDVVEYVVG